MPRVSRSPSHAGSWYEKEGTKLEQQIEGWLAKAKASGQPAGPAARAIIAPHAGYSYCGHVMAHAYQHIDPDSVRRVFLLGPSHYLATRKCVLSGAQEYATPLGPLPIDAGVYAELQATGAFEAMDMDADETEHSLELHAPYIRKIMGSRAFSLVPIMVGALSTEGEARYGALLAPYLADASHLFIISSDFCHWGSRFRYTFTNKEQGPIWRSIQWLDELGMRTIEKVRAGLKLVGRALLWRVGPKAAGQCDPAAFTAYQQKYQNTICGRHPIAVLLQMVAHSAAKWSIAFNCYDQSSKATSSSDSSVSYAAAVMTPL